MAKASRADASTAVGIGCDVEDNIIGTRRVARDCPYTGKVIKPQVVANPPGDVVVSAGRVSADADCADNPLADTVECQAPAEDVNAADFLAHQGILSGAVQLRRTLYASSLLTGLLACNP